MSEEITVTLPESEYKRLREIEASKDQIMVFTNLSLYWDSYSFTGYSGEDEMIKRIVKVNETQTEVIEHLGSSFLARLGFLFRGKARTYRNWSW